MPKFIAKAAQTWSREKAAALVLGTLFVLLGAAYFSRSSFPADEARWELLQVFAPALALFYLAAALLKREKIDFRLSSFQLGILLLFAWSAISGSWAINRVSFPVSLLDMSSMLIVLLFFSVALRDHEQGLPFFFMALFSTLVASVGVLQYFGLDGDLFFQYVKPASFFVNKNYASPIVAASLPLLGLVLLSGPPLRRRLPLLAVYYLNFTYLLVSGTKSSWLAYFAAMAIFASVAFNVEAYRKHFPKDFLLKTLTLIASTVFLVLVQAYLHNHGPFPVMTRDLLPQIWTILLLTAFTAVSPLLTAGLIYLWRRIAALHRLLPHLMLLFLGGGATICFLLQLPTILAQVSASLSLGAATSDMLSSWSARIPLWLNSLVIIRDHPLQGVGLGGFESAYPLYHKAAMNDIAYSDRLWIGGTHNDPLQLLTELGLVGLALAAFCFFMISRYFHTMMKGAAPATAILLTGCYVGGVALLLESLFSPVLHQASCLLLLAFFIGTIHSLHYAGPFLPERFSWRREVPAGKRLLYLAPLAVFFFLMLSISAPWAVRRYQGFVSHKEAMLYFSSRMDEKCYEKLREANNYWPYSNIITSETMSAAYFQLQHNFSGENLRQTREYNQRALLALPYHYNPNLVRIALLKYPPNNRSEIGKYAPLLLKVTPDENLVEAQVEINS